MTHIAQHCALLTELHISGMAFPLNNDQLHPLLRRPKTPFELQEDLSRPPAQREMFANKPLHTLDISCNKTEKVRSLLLENIITRSTALRHLDISDTVTITLTTVDALRALPGLTVVKRFQEDERRLDVRKKWGILVARCVIQRSKERGQEQLIAVADHLRLGFKRKFAKAHHHRRSGANILWIPGWKCGWWCYVRVTYFWQKKEVGSYTIKLH